MFPFSHFLTGHLVGMVLVTLGLVDVFNTNVALFGLISLLPDADAFWHEKIGIHHETLFHAPIFWIAVSALIAIESPGIAVIVSAMTLSHILTDFITGRTVGIAFLYPLNDKEYSLYPLNGETAGLRPVRPEKEMLKQHLSSYVENKTLLLFEGALAVSGAVASSC